MGLPKGRHYPLLNEWAQSRDALEDQLSSFAWLHSHYLSLAYPMFVVLCASVIDHYQHGAFHDPNVEPISSHSNFVLKQSTLKG